VTVAGFVEALSSPAETTTTASTGADGLSRAQTLQRAASVGMSRQASATSMGRAKAPVLKDQAVPGDLIVRISSQGAVAVPGSGTIPVAEVLSGSRSGRGIAARIAAVADVCNGLSAAAEAIELVLDMWAAKAGVGSTISPLLRPDCEE
jgi:hypothetical protein